MYRMADGTLLANAFVLRRGVRVVEPYLPPREKHWPSGAYANFSGVTGPKPGA